MVVMFYVVLYWPNPCRRVGTQLRSSVTVPCLLECEMEAEQPQNDGMVPLKFAGTERSIGQVKPEAVGLGSWRAWSQEQ